MAVPGGSEEIMLDLGIRQASKVAEMAKTMLVADSEADKDGKKGSPRKAKL